MATFIFVEKSPLLIEMPNFEKNSKFGLTSFIKVVENGTITKNRSQTPHDSIENTEYTTLVQFMFKSKKDRKI